MISGGKAHLEVKLLALLLNPLKWVRIAGSSLMDGAGHSLPLPATREGVKTHKVSLLIAHFSPAWGSHCTRAWRQGGEMLEDLDSGRQEGAGPSPLHRSLSYLKLSCSGANDPPLPAPGLCPEVTGGKGG